MKFLVSFATTIYVGYHHLHVAGLQLCLTASMAAKIHWLHETIVYATKNTRTHKTWWLCKMPTHSLSRVWHD